MVASADAGESLTATLVGVQSCSQNMIGFLDHMAYMADDQRVRGMCDRQVLVWIIQRRQEMQHRVDPRAFLVVRFHHGPRCICGVGVKEHRLFGFGVIVPFVQRRFINRAKLPLF